MVARRVVCGTLVLALTVLPVPSGAWGPVGHKAIAMIAQSRLSPQTLQAIRDLMGKNINLDWLANCADVFVHSNGHYLCAGMIELDGNPEESRPWHYINIPISDEPDAASLGSYCKNGQDCVVAQIRQDMAVLQNPGAPRQARQIALMYLIHFAGDAHQPLHCADDNDAGGNLKPTNVSAKDGKFLNLHQVWDHAIGNPDQAGPNGNTGLQAPEEFSAEAHNLAGRLEADLGDPQAHPAGEIESWDQGDLPGEMALESFQIAKKTIYPEYAQDQGRIADAGNARDIGMDYQNAMQPVAYRRLEMAGVRLAFLLEQAFSGPRQGPANAPLDLQPSVKRINEMLQRLHHHGSPFQ